MGKFSANVIRMEVMTIVVEADNEDTAEEKAREAAYDEDWSKSLFVDYAVDGVAKL